MLESGIQAPNFTLPDKDGKVSMGVVRSTYVIDENGVIEKVMPKVKPDTNAAEILEYLQNG